MCPIDRFVIFFLEGLFAYPAPRPGKRDGAESPRPLGWQRYPPRLLAAGRALLRLFSFIARYETLLLSEAVGEDGLGLSGPTGLLSPSPQPHDPTPCAGKRKGPSRPGPSTLTVEYQLMMLLASIHLNLLCGSVTEWSVDS